MRCALVVAMVVACGDSKSASREPAPKPLPKTASALGDIKPRDSEPAPRPSGQLAGETVLGAMRMQQGDMRRFVWRSAGELWALSWDGVVASTHPKDPIDGTNGLWIWDPVKREVKRRVGGRIHDFAIAERASLVAVVDQIGGHVALLDLASLDERWSSSIPEASHVAITPDGATVIVGDGLGTISVLDARDGRVVWSEPTHQKYVTAVEVSPTGKYFATSGSDVDVVIRDTGTRKKVATIKHHALDGDEEAGGVNSIAFAPDESAIATGGWDRVVRVSVLPSGKERLAIVAKQDVLAVAWSPDGAWLASGGRNNDVHLWRASDGKAGAAIAGHGSMVAALAFSRDGKQLASGAAYGKDFMIKLWDVASGTEVGGGGHGQQVRSIDVTSDGATMISVGADRRVIEWDVAKQTERGSFTEQYYHPQYAVAADAKLIVQPGEVEGVDVLSIPTGATYAKVAVGKGRVDHLAIMRDGTRFAAVIDDKVVVFALPSGKQLRAIDLPDQVTMQVGFCDGGRAVWHKGLAGVSIVDIASGKRRALVASKQPGEIASAEVSADCKRVLTTRWLRADEGTTLREVASGRALFSVPKVSGASFSQDETRIVANDGAGIALIDAATGTIVHRYPGHASAVTALALLPDGRVISGGEDALIKIWPKP